MPLSKVQKKESFDKLSTIFGDAQSVVFVNFHGLKVFDANALRRKLKSDGVGFIVAKKSITKKVLDTKKYEGSLPELVGEVGLAYGKDLIAPARDVYEFQKKYKDSVKILGGIFEGVYKNQNDMIAIASIPSMQNLRGMFVNVINSPIQGFVVALNAIVGKKA